MRKSSKVRRTVAILAAFAMVFNMSFVPNTIYASDDYDYEDDYDEDDEEIYDESDEFSISEEDLVLMKGDSKELEVEGDYDSVSWTSDDKSVATVDSDGLVTAKKVGTTTIYAEVTYTVYNRDDADESDEQDYFMESLYDAYDIDDEESNDEGDIDDIDDTVSEDDEDITDVSDNSGDVDDIDDTGAWDGEEESDECVMILACEITVINPQLSDTKVTLKVGKTKTLKVKGAASGSKITWTSSKKKVATVNKSGKVTAKKAGKTEVKAKISGGKTLKCTVTVKSDKKKK